MTAFDTSGNIQTEVQDISTYTIGTSGTITDAAFLRFLQKAEDQVSLDDPGFTLAQCTEAVALLICHQIARKKGQTGKTSLSIGKYSYSKTLKSGLTSWMDEYNALIASVGGGVGALSSDGITRDDATMQGLGLDQSIPYDLENEVRTN